MVSLPCVMTTFSDLKKQLLMNAEPEAFLQLTQWHTKKVNGSPFSSYLTALHKQEPCLMVSEDMFSLVLYFPLKRRGKAA